MSEQEPDLAAFLGETEEENELNIDPGEAIFFNRFFNKKLLTKVEALDLINHLSGMLLINEHNR